MFSRAFRTLGAELHIFPNLPLGHVFLFRVLIGLLGFGGVTLLSFYSHAGKLLFP